VPANPPGAFESLLGFPANNAFQLGSVFPKNDGIKNNDYRYDRPVSVIKQEVVGGNIRNVRANQNERQGDGTIHHQEKSGARFDSLNEIDIPARHQDLHEGVKARNWNKSMKSIEAEGQKNQTQKKPRNAAAL
jgi:hypothetical protein